VQITGLIAVLDEALAYDPARHHNSPPPALYEELKLGDANNSAGIKKLIAELKRLNELLEKAKPPQKPFIETRKHLNTFFNQYAKTVGTGAGVLTIAVAASALHSLGWIDPAMMISKWK